MQSVGLIILIVLAGLGVVGAIAWTLVSRWMRHGLQRTRQRKAPARGASSERTNHEGKRVVVPARGGDNARIVVAAAVAEAVIATAPVASLNLPTATEPAAGVDGIIDAGTGDTTWPSTAWHSTSWHSTTWPPTQPFALSQVPTHLAETEPMPLESLTPAR